MGRGEERFFANYFKKSVDGDDISDILVIVEIGQVKRLRYAD
jgi:hypothetical protein